MTLSITSLFTPATQQQWLAQILSNAQVTGLATTAWQSGGVARTILSVVASLLASSDANVISTMNQGGFLSSASAVTPDPSVFPGVAPGWLDVVADGGYNCQRIQPFSAAGTMSIVNAGATTYGPFAVGSYHVANPTTKATYSNSAILTIGPNATTSSAFVADVAGAGSTSAPGAISQAVTSLLGVTVTNAATFAGTNAESNTALVARCRLKLQSLSSNGAVGAYKFFALSATSAPYNVTLAAPVNRVSVPPSFGTGTVNVYLANANGPSSGPDVSAVATLLQAYCVPNGVRCVTLPSTQSLVNVVTDVWVPAAYSSGITALVTSAITNYFGQVPIGGLNDDAVNELPYDAVLSAIFGAGVPAGSVAPTPSYVQQATLTLNAGTSNVTLLSTDVPVVNSLTVNVHSV